MLLHRKNIRMSPCSGKNTIFSINFINQQPIWSNMQISVLLPDTLQRMILVLRRQFFFIQQNTHDHLELFKVISSLLHFFQVAAKLRRVNRITHLNTQLTKKIVCILGAVQIFTSVNFFQRSASQFIGDFRPERQALFLGNLGQHHTTGVGNRQAHPRQHCSSLILNRWIDTSTNIIIGRHSFFPCFANCSPFGHNVNSAEE